jgi:serine/threonine protein kinase/tetratricopeptide (TPR) repeat protein
MHVPSIQPHPRYEILGLIGSGDFAAVYKARDRDLGREVAIKQIHAQYLNDPQRLERFWREAQLLASLEHPHIMTIYDIVRSHGWLVLELMQGTLLDYTRGQPIDLALLRSTLSGSLQALALLHSRGTLHGDIKPTNLLIDKLGRVKLGDFGLSRRVASDQGSYLKGATRYMAPEMAAPQFGPVGPWSDLYSLGFTAYELLCGTQQFELLFPGLDAFGRDKQVAWMMWHAAPDRRLPPVASVLGGVPDDLARAIDRLTQKDQSQRYRSAEQALADIGRSGEVTAPLQDELAQEEAAKKSSARQRRLVTIAALLASVLLSVVILVFPGDKPAPPPAPPPPEAVRGVVRNILPERNILIIEDSLGNRQEYRLEPDDTLTLNEQAIPLRDLRELDQVAVTVHEDEHGERLEIVADRPRGDEGKIAQVTPDEGELTITLAGDKELLVTVGPKCPIQLNGSAQTVQGQPVSLADLAPGDRATVEHYQDATGRIALAVSARRIVPGKGVVRSLDAKKNEVTIAAGPEDGAATTVLPIADQCEVVLNGRRLIDGRLLTAADLKIGDAIDYQRDVALVSIAIQRAFQQTGSITAIRYDVRSFAAKTADGSERTFLLKPECQVFLAGDKVTFDDLRKSDSVEVSFDSPDAESPEVSTIVATRPANPSKWAILVTGALFDDSTVPQFPKAAAETSALKTMLVSRYAVPEGQIIALEDPSRVRLEQGFIDAVSKASKAGQLLVLLAVRVAIDKDGAPVIAPRDYAAARGASTGVPLAALVAEVEKSPVKEKIVLVDASPVAPITGDPPTAALFEKIQGTRSRPLLKTTHLFAATTAPVAGPGAEARLAAALATAVAGAGDPNKDNLCDVTELNDFFKTAAGGSPPRLFLPNSTPPRISDDAKEAIRRLAALIGQAALDPSEAQLAFQAATTLVPQEPEPRLIAALVLIKAKKSDAALDYLRAVLVRQPGHLLALEASAWAKFEKRSYAEAIADLLQLVKALPADAPTATQQRIYPWVGRLREYCGAALPPDKRPTETSLAALDAAIAAKGAAAQTLVQQGRSAVKETLAALDARIAAETDDVKRLQLLQLERPVLRRYAAWSPETAAQEVLEHLDD